MTRHSKEELLGLTVACLPVLDVFPEQLLVQGLALAGHMAGLSCGLLQDQAAAVVANASHHIQAPWSPGHYHLVLHLHMKRSVATIMAALMSLAAATMVRACFVAS